MRPSPDSMPTLLNEEHTEVGSLMLGTATNRFVRRRCVSEFWVGGLEEGRGEAIEAAYSHQLKNVLNLC